MERFGEIVRWLADKLRLQGNPGQPEGLEGSPLDLARCLEMAVDHCSLAPDLGAPPSEPEKDPDQS